MSGYDYYDPWSEIDGSAVAGVAGVVLGIFLIVMLLIMVLGVAMYVLSSLGMYKIAQRRGIRNPWLSWIPVGNMWILGCISDQYQYLVKGKIRNRRKVLIGLEVATAVSYFLYAVAQVVTALSFGAADVPMAVVAVLYVVMNAGLSIVLMVFSYIAYYDLFVSCDPGHAEVYLVLSILFNITMPFFLFACRNKDGGMPPRKAEIPEAVPQPEDAVQEAAPAVPEMAALPEEVPAEELQE